MQYINFIRDIEEDNTLQRIYLPLSEMKKFGLKTLRKDEAEKHPEKFVSFIRYQLERYQKWQKEAEKGYCFIPKKYLVPIKTASDLYIWTAGIIEKDPFIVYREKVKPSRLRIFLTGIKNSLLYFPLFYRSKNKWQMGNIEH